MTTDNNQKESTKAFVNLVEKFRYAMLATKETNEIRFHARPMHIVDFNEETLTLRFITSIESEKVDEIIRHPSAVVTLQDGPTCASLSGSATINQDQREIDKHWEPQMNIWFNGSEDNTVAIIEFRPQYCEFWDMKAGSLAKMIIREAKALFTGDNVKWSNHLHQRIDNTPEHLNSN